jgi:hypothetical protein
MAARRFRLSDNLAGSVRWVGEGVGAEARNFFQPVPSAWQLLGDVLRIAPEILSVREHQGKR